MEMICLKKALLGGGVAKHNACCILGRLCVSKIVDCCEFVVYTIYNLWHLH